MKKDLGQTRLDVIEQTEEGTLATTDFVVDDRPINILFSLLPITRDGVINLNFDSLSREEQILLLKRAAEKFDDYYDDEEDYVDIEFEKLTSNLISDD